MRARWTLGRLLEIVERRTGPGRGKVVKQFNSFSAYIKRLGLTPPTAMAAQRFGKLPAKELDGAFAAARKEGKPRHIGFAAHASRMMVVLAGHDGHC
jgi:hypothetical protein